VKKLRVDEGEKKTEKRNVGKMDKKECSVWPSKTESKGSDGWCGAFAEEEEKANSRLK
jgi:hypothetical protein